MKHRTPKSAQRTLICLLPQMTIDELIDDIARPWCMSPGRKRNYVMEHWNDNVINAINHRFQTLMTRANQHD